MKHFDKPCSIRVILQMDFSNNQTFPRLLGNYLCCTGLADISGQRRNRMYGLRTGCQTIEFSHLPGGAAHLEEELTWKSSSLGGAYLEEELAWLLSAADWRSELVMGGIMLCSTAAHVIGGRVIYLWGLPVGGAGPCAGGLSPPPLPLQSWSEEEL